MHVCGSFSRRTTSVRLGYLWQLQNGSFPTLTQGATLKTEQKSPSTQNFVKRRFSERPRIPERKNLIFKNTNVDGQIWKITFVRKCNALCFRKCSPQCDSGLLLQPLLTAVSVTGRPWQRWVGLFLIQPPVAILEFLTWEAKEGHNFFSPANIFSE